MNETDVLKKQAQLDELAQRVDQMRTEIAAAEVVLPEKLKALGESVLAGKDPKTLSEEIYQGRQRIEAGRVAVDAAMKQAEVLRAELYQVRYQAAITRSADNVKDFEQILADEIKVFGQMFQIGLRLVKADQLAHTLYTQFQIGPGFFVGLPSTAYHLAWLGDLPRTAHEILEVIEEQHPKIFRGCGVPDRQARRAMMGA